MNTKKLFEFIPAKIGDTTIYFYHREGYYRDVDYNFSDKFSILHNSKQKPSYISDRFSVFKEIVHWLRIYRMQNGREAIIPDKIVVWEAGKSTELTFNPLLFKGLVCILNKLPNKYLKYNGFKRVYGM